MQVEKSVAALRLKRQREQRVEPVIPTEKNRAARRKLKALARAATKPRGFKNESDPD